MANSRPRRLNVEGLAALEAHGKECVGGGVLPQNPCVAAAVATSLQPSYCAWRHAQLFWYSDVNFPLRLRMEIGLGDIKETQLKVRLLRVALCELAKQTSLGL